MLRRYFMRLTVQYVKDEVKTLRNTGPTKTRQGGLFINRHTRSVEESQTIKHNSRWLMCVVLERSFARIFAQFGYFCAHGPISVGCRQLSVRPAASLCLEPPDRTTQPQPTANTHKGRKAQRRTPSGQHNWFGLPTEEGWVGGSVWCLQEKGVTPVCDSGI